jgi:anthranilate/para-aminobenzoate synthase component I
VLGYFSASGAVDLSVVIRALVVAGAGSRVSVGAGGAVTWSSVAADEADEVETKVVSALAGIGVRGVAW